MKSLLLIALVSLVHTIYASEHAAANGFYLNRQPMTVVQACNISFKREGFHELPGPSIVAPLSGMDSEMVKRVVVLESNRIVALEHGILDEWMDALQPAERHPSLQQCVALYQHVRIVAGMHVSCRTAKALNVRKVKPNHMREWAWPEIMACYAPH